MDPYLTLASLVLIVMLAGLALWLFPAARGLNGDRITRTFAALYPDEAVTDCLISRNGQTGLAQLTRSDAIGLVRTLGDRISCRLLSEHDPLDWSVQQHDDRLILTLRLDDFTFPVIRIDMLPRDRDRAERWLKRWGSHIPQNAGATGA